MSEYELPNSEFEEMYCPVCGAELIAHTAEELNAIDVREGLEVHKALDMVFIHE